MRYLKWIALLQVYFLKFLPINLHGQAALAIETVSPEGTFCDTVQIPSSVGDMELI